MKNYNDINYDYHVPLGKPGALIAKIPIILTHLEFSFPLYFKLKPKNYINLDDNSSDSNNVILNNVSISKNNKLLINGLFIKKIKYCSVSYDKAVDKCAILKIPINKILNIKFLKKPNLYTDKTNIFNKHNYSPIKYSIDHIKISDNCFCFKNNNSISKLTLSIKLYLYQMQNVFIPEPEGDFILLNKDSPYFKCSNPTCSDLYVVGYNKDKGLIADYDNDLYK